MEAMKQWKPICPNNIDQEERGAAFQQLLRVYKCLRAEPFNFSAKRMAPIYKRYSVKQLKTVIICFTNVEDGM